MSESINPGNSKEQIPIPKQEEAGENTSPQESIEQTETQIKTSDITTSDIQNMEVHHHLHIEKKNFKEYFLEL